MRISEGEDLTDYDLSDFPGLQALSQFARMLPAVPWFAGLAEAPDEREILLAEEFLVGLGFPDTEVVWVDDWAEAAEAARNVDWNTAGWEAEEQVRMALTAEACEHADEEMVMLALAHVSTVVAEAAQAQAEALLEAEPALDEELLRAAVGAAAQAAYHAALVLAAEEEEPDVHPFSLKYRLFESGRWPLGIVGRSFHVF